MNTLYIALQPGSQTCQPLCCTSTVQVAAPQHTYISLKSHRVESSTCTAWQVYVCQGSTTGGGNSSNPLHAGLAVPPVVPCRYAQMISKLSHQLKLFSGQGAASKTCNNPVFGNIQRVRYHSAQRVRSTSNEASHAQRAQKPSIKQYTLHLFRDLYAEFRVYSSIKGFWAPWVSLPHKPRTR